MNNVVFVKKYIAATKAGELDWENLSATLRAQLEWRFSGEKFEQAYFLERNDRYILINRNVTYDAFENETGYSYYLLILDRLCNELFRITEESILDSDDGVLIPNGASNKRLLSRLYRLAERSAKRIDALLEQLTAGLTSTGDDLI